MSELKLRPPKGQGFEPSVMITKVVYYASGIDGQGLELDLGSKLNCENRENLHP
jgi:hypothetical protein